MTFTDFDSNWEKAKKAVQNNTEMRIVEHGWEQHVIIDDMNNLVYRYPRHASAAAKLNDEVGLLASLNQRTWPIAIPYLRHHTLEYTVYDYIAGEVLTKDKIQTLKSQELEEIGQTLGTFLAILHATDSAVVDRKKTKQTMSLYEYYRGRINSARDSAFFANAWADLHVIQASDPTEQVVVHGDLHGLNMVIDPKSKRLVGVIDFSEVEVGDPNQDFRKIFMTDEHLLTPAMAAYEDASGAKLSESKIKRWAYVNEWANICHFQNDPSNPTYKRAYGHLEQWGRLKV